MVLDASLLITHHYKVRVKWSNPRKGVALSHLPWWSSYWKRNLQITLETLLYLFHLNNWRLSMSQLWIVYYYSHNSESGSTWKNIWPYNINWFTPLKEDGLSICTNKSRESDGQSWVFLGENARSNFHEHSVKVRSSKDILCGALHNLIKNKGIL